jgi:hypothetical protein
MVRGESVSYQCRDWGGRVVSVQQVRERLSATCAHTPETAERGLDLKMKFLTDGPLKYSRSAGLRELEPFLLPQLCGHLRYVNLIAQAKLTLARSATIDAGYNVDSASHANKGFVSPEASALKSGSPLLSRTRRRRSQRMVMQTTICSARRAQATATTLPEIARLILHLMSSQKWPLIQAWDTNTWAGTGGPATGAGGRRRTASTEWSSPHSFTTCLKNVVVPLRLAREHNASGCNLHRTSTGPLA